MQKEEIHNLIKELINKTIDLSGDILITEETKPFNSKEGGVSSVTWFEVSAKNPHVFLNRDGEAISALNHLARRIVESKLAQAPNTPNNQIMIDINGFEKKKIDNIKAIVHMMAERARYFKANVEVDPMSAYERRIAHEFLADATDLKTESVGVGPSRRVVIKYIGSI